jgi:hypothetical protein
VGLTLEARSDAGHTGFEFLHLQIDWDSTVSNTTVSPLHRNLDYATGQAKYQKFATCQLWLSTRVQNSSHLRPFVLAKLASFGHTFDGAARHPAAVHSVAVLLSEILLLRWPMLWVAKLLRGYDIAYRTSFCHYVRLVGKMLHDDTNLPPLLDQRRPGCEIFSACRDVCQHALATMHM